MKKIFSLFAVASLVISLSVCLFACGNNDTDESNITSVPQDNQSTIDSQTHEHSYANDKWEHDETGHYRPCICHTEFKNYDDHFDTVDKNGLCDVCQFEMESEKTVSVIVKDTDGTPVKGAEIKLYTQSVEHTVVTDENGSCSGSFVYTSGLKAMVLSLPDEYKRLEKSIFSIYDNTLTIVVEKK